MPNLESAYVSPRSSHQAFTPPNQIRNVANVNILSYLYVGKYSARIGKALESGLKHPIGTPCTPKVQSAGELPLLPPAAASGILTFRPKSDRPPGQSATWSRLSSLQRRHSCRRNPASISTERVIRAAQPEFRSQFRRSWFFTSQGIERQGFVSGHGFSRAGPQCATSEFRFRPYSASPSPRSRCNKCRIVQRSVQPGFAARDESVGNGAEATVAGAELADGGG